MTVEDSSTRVEVVTKITKQNYQGVKAVVDFGRGLTQASGRVDAQCE